MADILSQNDLDALWASGSDEATKKTESAPDAAEGDGVSNSDLDALFAGLGRGAEGNTPSEADQSPPGGLSQSDLDALWGGLSETTAGLAEPTVVAGEPSSAPKSENLSQDDIDKLLEEMGR
jgi:flagellar motor switch protein FliM